MNGYPYPVLTETDSAYLENIFFNISFLKYEYEGNRVKFFLNADLNSESLKQYIENEDAEILIRVKTGICVKIFKKAKFEEKIVIELECGDIKANDTIEVSANIIARHSFVLTKSDEILDCFGTEYSVTLRKADVLAISNTEKLNYNTTSNDFIKFKSSPDMNNCGFKIRLADLNYIEVLVGEEFNHSYGVLKNSKAAAKISPILNSHIIFEVILYTLVEIIQEKDDYTQKEWYRLFEQAFLATGETIEEFKEKAYDDKTIDISYVYEMAQIMISNSLETPVISVSKMGD